MELRSALTSGCFFPLTSVLLVRLSVWAALDSSAKQLDVPWAGPEEISVETG